MPCLDIAIVGGGVCGLTCAAVLNKYGVKADVYESAVRLCLFFLLVIRSRYLHFLFSFTLNPTPFSPGSIRGDRCRRRVR